MLKSIETTLIKGNFMTRKNSTVVASSETATNIAADIFASLVGDKLASKAKVVITEFVRKDDERQSEIAAINSSISDTNAEIEVLKGKLAKAEKVTNQAALKKSIAICKADISVFQAEIEELQTLRSAANDRKNTFITKFDTDPYAALADNNIVLDFIAKKVAKLA